MEQEIGKTESPARHAPADETLERWRRLVEELPDLRLEKVLATRKALRAREYDRPAVLEDTIDRLQADLGLGGDTEFQPDEPMAR